MSKEEPFPDGIGVTLKTVRGEGAEGGVSRLPCTMFSVRGQHSGVWGHLSSHLSSHRSSHLSSHLLLTVVLCQALHVGGWFLVSKDRIEEDASYNHMYYVGENLTVHCIKLSDFTGEVYFQLGNVNYRPEYVTQINTTHALFDKPVTDDDFEETTLTCADGDGQVATANIYTDYAPREATDLKMVWLNEKFLFINWAFNNTSYKNGHDKRLIQVTGEWSYDATNATGWSVCYSGDLNNAACNVTGITYEWATVYVRVNITNVIRKDLVSTVFPGLPIRDHVKPLPAQQVKVVTLNSTTVRVSVTADRNLLVFHIKYFTMLSHNYINNTLVTDRTSEKSFDISGLHPDYTYHFEVRCKIDIDRGYLSDLPQSTPEVRMPEDAPSAAPEVEPGSFYLDRSSCKSSDARLYIYHQELADEDKNGKIVNYTATVVLDGENVTSQSGAPRTVKLDSVPCGGNYDVTLHANTAVGPSPGAVLHVPRWSEEPDSIVDKLKLKLRLNKYNGAITAEWEPVADTHNMSLLLYYCNEASHDNAMCQSAIHHVNITAANDSYLPLPSADANMKFGVAAILQDDATTGIKFTKCIYDPTKVSPIPSDVRATGQTDSISVTWKGEDACDSTKRIIIYNYEIELVVPGGSENISHVVDASSGVHHVWDVRRDTDYQVRMRANTSSGVSDFSQSVSARLSSIVSGLTDEEIAGIAMAVLVVVLILGALVFCFCRDKFRAVKAKFSRSADIPTPTPRRVPREFQPVGHDGSSSRGGILNQGFEPVGTSAAVTHQHQDSQDSGYIGQDNSPTTPRQVALQGTDSVPPTGPTDLTHTDHTQSASPDGNVTSSADVTMANGDIQGDNSGCIVSSGELSAAADIIMANCDIQGDDSDGIVSPGEEPAAAVAECKPAHIPVPACFGEGESDEGHNTVGKGTLKDFPSLSDTGSKGTLKDFPSLSDTGSKGTLKDFPSLSDTGSNSYVRFSTEDCPRQGGEQRPGEPAQVVFSTEDCPRQGGEQRPGEPAQVVISTEDCPRQGGEQRPGEPAQVVISTEDCPRQGGEQRPGEQAQVVFSTEDCPRQGGEQRPGEPAQVVFSTEDCPRQGGEQRPGEPAQVVISTEDCPRQGGEQRPGEPAQVVISTEDCPRQGGEQRPGEPAQVVISTEDCPRQGGEQLSGEPAEVVINFSKGKGPATFEPVVGVVHVALSDSGTTPTAVNSGDGVDSEAKLDPKKEDNGWAAPAETVTDQTQDFTKDSAMNPVDRKVTVSVPESQGLGSYSQISSSGVTEKLHGQGTQEEEPSDERLEASPATVSPGYVTHDVTPLQAQSGPTRHVHQQDASDGLEDGAAPGRLEEPSPSPDVSLSSSTPGGRHDEPCNPANVNSEPENPIEQELSPATGHLPSVLSTPPAADSPPRPPQQPVEQEGGAVLDPQIDRDIDPAPQGHFDQKSQAAIPPLSAMPGGYVLCHVTSPDVSLPCPPPVQDGDDSEGGSLSTEKDAARSEESESSLSDSTPSQHTEKDAARSEESGSSLSDSTQSQSSNGAGYVPLATVEKMTLTLDSSAAMVTADESDAGGREGGGGRGGFERLDSGYSSPNPSQRSPQWRSSPGFTSEQEKPHNDNDDGTFNLAPAEPAMAATKKGVDTQRHGEGIKGENAGNEGVAKQRHGERNKGDNAGKERGSLGGALVMSSSTMRKASSGYVERNDVFAAPPETSI